MKQQLSLKHLMVSCELKKLIKMFDKKTTINLDKKLATFRDFNVLLFDNDFNAYIIMAIQLRSKLLLQYKTCFKFNYLS